MSSCLVAVFHAIFNCWSVDLGLANDFLEPLWGHGGAYDGATPCQPTEPSTLMFKLVLSGTVTPVPSCDTYPQRTG